MLEMFLQQTITVLSETTLFAKVVNGVLTLETAYSDYSLFAVEQSTLPAGGVAGRFIYLGTNESQISGIWDEITFDLNGGTWDESTDDVVVMGIQGNKISDYELDPIPTYADHYFNGWFTDAECTIPLNPVEILTEDITLYAGWLELFDVTYSGNEGTIENCEIIEDVRRNLVSSAYGILQLVIIGLVHFGLLMSLGMTATEVNREQFMLFGIQLSNYLCI